MKNAPKQKKQDMVKRFIMIEFRIAQKVANQIPPLEFASKIMQSVSVDFDKTYEPLPVTRSQITKTERIQKELPHVHYVIRSETTAKEEEKIKAHRDVVAIWDDPEIHEADWSPRGGWEHVGRLERVKELLGLDELRMAAHDGRGIIVGVVDGGITATGRTPVTPVPSTIDGVIGGYPRVDWGQYAFHQNFHGNMMAYIIRSIAPECKLLDLRTVNRPVSPFPIRLSNVGWCYQYALNLYNGRERITGYPNGIPHILTNSWCIYQQGWDDTAYAWDMNHPFISKVIEVIDRGVIVLFCAGNAGLPSPNDRCGIRPDGLIDPVVRDANTGPEKSIWGANAHPRTITVGAVTITNERIGYSSQGPARVKMTVGTGAMTSRFEILVPKPDFCSYSAFFGGYEAAVINSGTSSATAVTAGVIALLKAAHPTATHDEIKAALIQTAINNYTHSSWHPNTGAGTLHAGAAHRYLSGVPPYVFGRPEFR